jgi:hypothetical protein
VAKERVRLKAQNLNFYAYLRITAFSEDSGVLLYYQPFSLYGEQVSVLLEVKYGKSKGKREGLIEELGIR